jgi:HlyD family secretion protein
MRTRRGRALLTLLIAVVVIGGVLLVQERQGEAPPPPLVGMVRQTEIRIAPETSGRLASILVHPGQHVHKGDVLALLDKPELSAAVEEARAAAASAKADRARVYSGVRAEEVDITADDVQRAKAQLVLAQQQNYRAVTLAAKNFASRQNLDESTADLAKAQADVDLRSALYAADKAGPTVEERALSDAKVVLASASVADLEAELGKTKLVAPADGEIGVQVGELGEIIEPGKPVLTMEIENAPWFAFTLREDKMFGLTIGATIGILGPDGKRIDARVTELRPLGEFATYRAARAVGDHDLNSFALRLDPTQPSGLAPGMTVWLRPRA